MRDWTRLFRVHARITMSRSINMGRSVRRSQRLIFAALILRPTS